MCKTDTCRVAAFFVALLALTAACPRRAVAQADLTVKVHADRVGIDLSGLSASGGSGALFLTTLRNDLVRWGWFAPQNGAQVVVRGSFADTGRSVGVTFDVANRSTGRSYCRPSLSEESGRTTRLAHLAADAIVKGVLNKPGIAATHFALIGARGGQKDLYMCDADGAGLVNISRRGAVCLSPGWDPTGEKIVYTSFHRGYPDVYLVDLPRKRMSTLVGYPGLNAGADISPDGRQMVLTLSKDGNPDLYIIDLASRRLTRITRTPHGAEASPSWSPDGRQIVYVSDKSGWPQLYVVSATGGAETRITFRGSENVSPDWGPDGRVVYASRRGSRYQLCMITPGKPGEEELTRDDCDHEDPCWAPDARHIAYVQSVRYQSDVYILDTMGGPAIRLTTLQGDWYSPAWSNK